MAIFKRGRVYWFHFMFNGEHVQHSTRQGNPNVARQIEAAWRTKLAKGEVGIEEPKRTPIFAEFEKRFREEMRTRHQAKPKTISYYENGLNRLLEYELLRRTRLDRIDEALIADYVAKRRTAKKRNGKPIQVATINRELECLRRMLRLAQEWKVIQAVAKISRLPGEQQRDRILDHSEEQSYLAVAKQPLRDVAITMLDTGMRPEEVFRMCWENIHFQPAPKAKYGYVYNPFGKTKYARRNIPLTQRVKGLLEMRHLQQGEPADGWVFPALTKTGRLESLKSQHFRALKDSALCPFVLYTLRHTMLTRLGEAGADAFAIQKIAGHSSILISQRYVHPTPERIERAFAQLEATTAKRRRNSKKGRNGEKLGNCSEKICRCPTNHRYDSRYRALPEKPQRLASN